MKKIVLLTLVLCLNLSTYCQSLYRSYLKDPVGYREHSLDIKHLKLSVTFEPEKGLVKGHVEHQFSVLQQDVDSVFFDGPGIKIASSTLDGKPVQFRTTAEGVWVQFPQRMHWDQQGTIAFTYEATPRKGIYFIGWNVPESIVKNPFAVRKQIWTQGQAVDNRYWIPMYDEMNDKFTTETSITFDNHFQVLSNGALIDKKTTKDGSTTWHYAMSKPHAGYLLMIAIGKYGVQTAKSKSGVPLQYWYYPEFEERCEPTFRYTPQMIDFMEAETGINYPWESYSQVMVQDFIFGAMENTTATVFGDFFNVDQNAFIDRNYVNVNMHELTHQWFGDFITARDSRDAWLQESFATYFPKQFAKKMEGVDEWSWQRRQHQNTAVDAGKKDNNPVRHTAGGTARIYPKGAAVISMLEYVLGEAQWKRVLNHYLKTHAYSSVETNDMQQAIKDVLGLNLDWFFDEWILRGGEPHYKVHFEDLTYANGSRGTEIAIEQIHATSETVLPFKMPIVLEVHYKDGSIDVVKEMLDKDFEIVKIGNPLKKEIDFVLFDPNSNVLKQVTFSKPIEALKSQLEKASFYLDRYDAAVALREFPIDAKRAALMASLKKETHYGIVNELVNQLASDQTAETQHLLQQMVHHPKSIVRENVLNQVKTIDNSWKPMYVSALQDSSNDVVKTALEKLCTQFPSESSVYLGSTRARLGMNNAVHIKWLELAILNNVETTAAREELKAYASPGYEFRTRNLAFGLLKTLNLCDEQICESLIQAMLSPNGRLAAPAAETANYLITQAQNRQIFKAVYQKQNLNFGQKEILKKYITSPL